jgi:hypothetical protein
MAESDGTGRDRGGAAPADGADRHERLQALGRKLDAARRIETSVPRRGSTSSLLGMAFRIAAELIAGLGGHAIIEVSATGPLDPAALSSLPAVRSVRHAPERPDAAAFVARAVRLRRDLGLNYAGALLACTLLDRIEQLEARLRQYESASRPVRR